MKVELASKKICFWIGQGLVQISSPAGNTIILGQGHVYLHFVRGIDQSDLFIWRDCTPP